MQNLYKSTQNHLIVSVIDENDKGYIDAVDLEDKTVRNIVKDNDYSIIGDISLDFSRAVYMDELNDINQRKIYSYDLESKKITKVKVNDYSKCNVRISNDNSIYFLTHIGKGIIKLGKIDLNTNECSLIDGKENRECCTFDIRNNTLVILTHMRLEESEEHKNSYEDLIYTYTIFKSDLNGSNLDKVTDIRALYISSVCMSYDEKKIIISGEDINGDLGEGIYEIDIESKNITKILNNNILANIENCNVKEMDCAETALSKDGETIYFVGVSKGNARVRVSGVEWNHKSIFSYSKKTKEIRKIYTPEINNMIVGVNIKY